MPDDSTFFSPANDQASKDVNLSDVLSLSKDEAKNLIHSSEAGWSEIWLINKNGRFRALKSLKPSFRGQARYESLLRKEYEIGYSLSHTAIREIYDFRNIPGLGNCIEMEWVDGVTLTEFLSGGRPARATAKKIALQLCDALSYLHSKQIVHRDLKPSNILITHNGNYLKLIDFGLSDASSWSILKGPAGTASFAAPELLAGGVIDNRTDIWSLGKVISLLLPDEKRIISRCLRENPAERFQDVSEVKAVLTQQHRGWPYLIALLAVSAAIVFLLIRPWSRWFNSTHQPPNADVEVVDTLDFVDANAIDELFRQATEMIDDAGSQ